MKWLFVIPMIGIAIFVLISQFDPSIVGAVFGSFTTVFGVWMAITHERKISDEDRIFNSRPIITAEILNTNCCALVNSVSGLEPSVYTQASLISQYGKLKYIDIMEGDGTNPSLYNTTELIKLKNVGKGSALNIKVYSGTDYDFSAVRLDAGLSLVPDEEKIFYLTIPVWDVAARKELHYSQFSIEYNDVFNKTHSTRFKTKIYKPKIDSGFDINLRIISSENSLEGSSLNIS